MISGDWLWANSRHGYGRWLAIVEDPQLGLGPVIRGELLLRGVNDAAGPSRNGDVQTDDPLGRG
jgi:chromodomain-helicase-DNA-binding protein 4